MKFFNKINGDFIKRGIILLGVIIGINVVYIGGNIYKNNDGDVKENKYVSDENYIGNVRDRVWPVKNKNTRITSNYGPRINPVTKR